MESSAQFRYASSINRGDLDGVVSSLKDGADPNLGPYGEKSFFPLDRILSRIHYVKTGSKYLRILETIMQAGADPLHMPDKHEHGALSFLAPSANGTHLLNWPEGLNVILSNWNSGVSWKHFCSQDGKSIVEKYTLSSDMLRVLLQHGIDPDTRSDDGSTALMGCVKHFEDNPLSAGILMNYGADPYLMDHRKNTVMRLALGTRNDPPKWKVIIELVNGGYDVKHEPDLAKFKTRLARRMRETNPVHREAHEAFDILNKQIIHGKLTARVSSIRPDLLDPNPSRKPKM